MSHARSRIQHNSESSRVFPTEAANRGYKGQQASPKILLNKAIFPLSNNIFPESQGVIARRDLPKRYTLQKKI